MTKIKEKMPCNREYSNEPHKDNIACQIIGCKKCKFSNGKEYYQSNIPKGVSMWAKDKIAEGGLK